MKESKAFNRTVAAWGPFLYRFKKIPEDYQMLILEEYEAARREKRPLDVEKMWKILILGENPELMYKILNKEKS